MRLGSPVLPLVSTTGSSPWNRAHRRNQECKVIAASPLPGWLRVAQALGSKGWVVWWHWCALFKRDEPCRSRKILFPHCPRIIMVGSLRDNSFLYNSESSTDGSPAKIPSHISAPWPLQPVWIATQPVHRPGWNQKPVKVLRICNTCFDLQCQHQKFERPVGFLVVMYTSRYSMLCLLEGEGTDSFWSFSEHCVKLTWPRNK